MRKVQIVRVFNVLHNLFKNLKNLLLNLRELYVTPKHF